MRIKGELLALLFAAGASACIPYTVGTTAQPVAAGKTTMAQMTYVMPSVNFDTTNTAPYSSSRNIAVDGEMRFGIDDYSDIGVRAVGYSGLVVNYKRLLWDTAGPLRVAIMLGFGIVNTGNHAYGEFTVVFSGREPPTHPVADSNRFNGTIVPYGGLRGSWVYPIDERAVRDKPTLGGFVGMRFGGTEFGISPEIGVFHDPSALGVRKKDVVVVPAVVFHGRIISLFRRLPRRFYEPSPVGGGVTDNGRPDIPILPPILMPPQVTPPVWAPVVRQPISSRRPGATCSGPPRACTAIHRSDATARPRS